MRNSEFVMCKKKNRKSISLEILSEIFWWVLYIKKGGAAGGHGGGWRLCKIIKLYKDPNFPSIPNNFNNPIPFMVFMNPMVLNNPSVFMNPTIL